MNPGDDGVAISRVVETAASWDGAPLPSYPRGAPRVTILRATVPPHTALAMHTHALVNAGVILRGELTVIAETGAQRMFRAGEGIVELVGTRHYGENRGDGWFFIVSGFFLGWQECVMLLISGQIFCGIFGLAIMVGAQIGTGRENIRKLRLPFLPFLLPASLWIVLMRMI